MENQRKMINDCPLNVPNDGVVATPDDLNGYFSVCADQKDFCTCSPFDIQGMYIILISDFFVEPLVYFAFLFVNETVITKTQGLVVAIAKREYIN